MKITSKGGVHNTENSVGFVNIEKWEGVEMRINVEYLKTALEVLNRLRDVGLDMESIHVGIAPDSDEQKGGVFCFFLDPNKTVAYAIAGKKED